MKIEYILAKLSLFGPQENELHKSEFLFNVTRLFGSNWKNALIFREIIIEKNE